MWSHGTYLSNGESNNVQQHTDGTSYSSHSKSETYAHCKNSSWTLLLRIQDGWIFISATTNTPKKQGGRMWLLHPGLDNQYKEEMFVKHLFYIFKKFKMAPWLLGQLLGKILWQLIKFIVKHAYYCFSHTVSLNLRHKIKSWNVFFKKVGAIWKFTVQF